MPQLQPPPYQDQQGTQRWSEWFRKINNLLSGLSISIGAADDVTLTGVIDNELLQWDDSAEVWANETNLVFPGTTDTEGAATFATTLTAVGKTDVEGNFTVGDEGFEGSGININGVTYNFGAKVSDIGGTDPGMLHLHRHSATLPAIFLGSRTAEDTSSHTAVALDDQLFRLAATGYTGSHYDIFGDIIFVADEAGTISATSAPGAIIFRTTDDGSQAPTERMRINAEGLVHVPGSIDSETSFLVAGTDIDTFYAEIEHSHTVGEVSGVAATEHSHVAAEVTDLSMEDNSDVTVGTPADENVLTWNDGAEYWEAQTAAAGAASLPQGYINGLILSTDTDAEHDINVAVGVCRGDADEDDINLTTTITKQFDATWSVGDDAGGMDTGTVAADTWYYVHMIKRSDTSVVDALFSLSSTAPTMPTSYDESRLIGEVYIDSTTDISPFTQTDDTFTWATQITSYATTPSTTSASITMRIPDDYPVLCHGDAIFSGPNSSYTMLLSIYSPGNTTTAYGQNRTIYASSILNVYLPLAAQQFSVYSDASGTIRTDANSATGTLTVQTIGWTSPRGRN